MRILRASPVTSRATDARHALLAHLFDYAGQFPPAELSLDDALDEWERIQESDDAWLANCFVAKPRQLEEIPRVEPLAVVDGPVERQGDLVFREGETKLRCGGARVPPVDEVAAFIRSCREREASFKATAGLHHALPTNGEHGFLNVLAAAVFGDEEEMLTTQEISLDADAFRANGRRATGEECVAVRRELFHSIGSCSFDEPVGELRALGIL